jgi:hypothetical protein
VQNLILAPPILPGGEVVEAILPHQTLSVNLIMFDTAGNYSQLICAAMRFGFPVTTDRVIGRYRGNRCLSSEHQISNIGRHISSNFGE